MREEIPVSFDVVFFHGKESGPHGRKYHALSEVLDVWSPDFRGMHIDERLARAEKLTEGMRDLVVVGSSYGGLLAALLYSKHPERFRTYVLLAPALLLDEESIDRMPTDAIVIHGRQDEIVPMAPTRAFCEPFGIRFVEVDDEHPLHQSMELIVDTVRAVVAAT